MADKGTSDPEMTTKKLAAIREKEQAEAAAHLGVKEVIYLRYGDGELNDTAKFRGELVRAIRKHKPEVVFCTDPFRQTFYLHRDHRISGQVTLDAVFPYARDFLHYNEHIQEGLETHKSRRCPDVGGPSTPTPSLTSPTPSRTRLTRSRSTPARSPAQAGTLTAS